MLRATFYVVLILALCSSCLSRKKTIYLQNEKFNKNTPFLVDNTSYIYQIQPSDVLSIRILSSNPDVTDVFNLSDPNANGLGLNRTSLYLTSYSVDVEGNIEIPQLGFMNVEGKTVDEIKAMVEEKLATFAKEDQTTVTVRLANFKVAVLGEVNRPGEYEIFNDRATIFDAIARGGDLRDFANRKEIKLLRRRGDKQEIILIDLTDDALLTSEYFYVKPNDVIYVEPLKARVGRLNLPLLSTIFSGIQLTVLIINLATR